MINVANLELCKELDKLSGWDDTELYWYQNWLMHDRWMVGTRTSSAEESYSAYDLGYLLRKLPPTIVLQQYGYVTKWQCIWRSVSSVLEVNEGKSITEIKPSHLRTDADTPEDATCMLAIEMFEQGILRREKS